MDVPTASSDTWNTPASLLKRGEWVDRASSDIPLRYVITAALLSDLSKSQGDSVAGARFLQTAFEMARAARVESVLGIGKEPPRTTDGPERH